MLKTLLKKWSGKYKESDKVKRYYRTKVLTKEVVQYLFNMKDVRRRMVN